MMGSEHYPDRRQFLTGASALVAAMHAPWMWATPWTRGPEVGDGDARILGLRLLTATPLAEMKNFYHRTLGLPVLEEGPDRLTIAG